ncbi:type II toxin-antitoxin system HicA family toxin [Alicyclobacillus sp. SP_1]|uniref:type II toxin-antitoxin system HicA family toxin n=1 Tax=Alicyclobacillus sp. SP_1 TaxID=2942475 RepID=UPI0021570DE8|nr:type II toxin-antitoxin system HicA family toxin [Alicyclobacillus sp. SP_1]
MPELPRMSGKAVVAVLTRHGWTVARISGSHYILHKPGHDPFSVPVHANRDLKVGTLRSILKSTGLSVAEFVEMLGK